MNKPKILVILGPTAVGKSGSAVLIAKKFNGEIISADSRQVYEGLDIGTGKITEKEMDGVPHYLLDIVSLKKGFDVSRYKRLAEEKIDKILKRGKLPIVVGGTGFYIQAIVDGLILPEVPANKELREELEKQSTKDLFEKLQKLDPRRAVMIYHNSSKRHLIRALEIVETLGRVPKLKKNPKYNTLQIGLDIKNQKTQQGSTSSGLSERDPISLTLKERIHKRLLERIDAGMIDEGKRVQKEIGFEGMMRLGLEYKYLALFLKGELSKGEMTEKLEIAIGQYAKRQRTWFKRDKRIHWFRPDQRTEIFELIQKFLFSSS